MEKRIIALLKTQTEPLRFYEIKDAILDTDAAMEYPATKVSKALRKLVRRNKVQIVCLGHAKTKFSGIAELPIWGYQLPTNSARKS